MAKKTTTKSKPMDTLKASQYLVSQNDADQVKQTILEVGEILKQWGSVRDQYLKSERRFEEAKDAAVNSQNMIVDMLRRKVGAPEGYVLNLTTLEFIPPPNVQGQQG